MKKVILEFVRRGLISAGFGPIVLAILYLILQKQNLLDILTVNQVCRGIFSLFALAFIAGGMNAIYQMERLPLMIAILIHGGGLYISYLGTYLLNDWLELGVFPILVFSGIFLIGYMIIWVIICSAIKKRTERMNEILNRKRQGMQGR